jgi:hypothetical protein
VDVEPFRSPGGQPFEHLGVEGPLRVAVPRRTGGNQLQARQTLPDLGIGGEFLESLDGVHGEGEGSQQVRQARSGK